jgi:hypothetical protein
MSNVNILIHAVWGTKNNVPYLTGNALETVTQHIVVNAGSKGICIAAISRSIMPERAGRRRWQSFLRYMRGRAKALEEWMVVQAR